MISKCWDRDRKYTNIVLMFYLNASINGSNRTYEVRFKECLHGYPGSSADNDAYSGRAVDTLTEDELMAVFNHRD